MVTETPARMSVDGLSPTASISRGDYPFRRRPSRSPHSPSARRGSTASSIHSVAGVLDFSSSTSTTSVLESGQNAISTLLQPPIVRTGLLPHSIAPTSSAHRPPTSRDIPPVTLTDIPHVDDSEFQVYISQVGAIHEQLQRVREPEEEGPPSVHRRTSRADYPEMLEDGYLKPARQPSSSRRRSNASISSIASIASLDPPRLLRRSSSSYRRITAQGPPPLSTVPAVYFDEDFHLENPRTFDVVSERSEVLQPSGNDDKGLNGHAAAPRKALSTNAILQEKLSWYMDTIEMHLIQSISTASTTFFSALGSLRELHAEAADSVEKIKALRKELEALDFEIVSRGLEIVHQRRRRENLQQLHNAVEQLREVVEGVAECESLVESGDVDGALDLIDDLEMLIAGEARGRDRPKTQLRDLSNTVSLQGVGSDLDNLRLRIGKAYEANFLSVMMGDMRRHVEAVSYREVLMRWSSASARIRRKHSVDASALPSYMASIDSLRAVLLSSLTGLQRAKFLTAVTTAYREAVLKEIKNIIRRPLPSSNDDDAESMQSSSTVRTGGRQRSQQDRSSMLARNLRALDPKDAEELFVKIYIGVTETLRRLSTQVKVLLDVAYSIGDSSPIALAGMKSPPLKSPPFSPRKSASSVALDAQEEIHKALDLPNLLGQAVDIAQDKIVKLLRVRSEQHSRLSLVWFLRYFTLNLYFANECEAISGRSGTVLKNVVNGHIKDFVQPHGDAENQKLAQGMDTDQWNAVDFNEKDEDVLQRILESSTKDSAAWDENDQIFRPYSDDGMEDGRAGKGSQSNGTGKPKLRSAVVDAEVFILPSSAVLCMRGIAQFMHLISAIPSITADVSLSLINYLRTFNSRCTQLILGAGATRSAGLKNITTKHLALAAQSLAFIAAIIPHVREFVRRRCGPGPTASQAVSQVMTEMDKVRRLYQEHQSNIYDKLVEIMSGRASAGVKKMKALDWDAQGAAPAAPHEYMETLVKETATLHRVLTKNLPEGTVRLIMMPVFNNYKDTFGNAFKAAEPKTEAGKQSMLCDVDFFVARLGKIDGFEEAGDILLDVVKKKGIGLKEPPKEPSKEPPSEPPSELPEDLPKQPPEELPSESSKELPMELHKEKENEVESPSKNGDAPNEAQGPPTYSESEPEKSENTADTTLEKDGGDTS